MIEVKIKNNTKTPFKFTKETTNLAKFVVNGEKIKGNSELALIIVADQKIRSLAKGYKNKDYVTDVLSFPNDWEDLYPLIKINSFGDIYINKNKVKTQSKAYGHSYKREFLYLFAHAFLHLLNYDHQNEKDEKIMHTKVKKYLNKIGV